MPVTLKVPGHFFNQNWEATVKAELHAGSDELGQLLLYKVSTRTAILTGALLSDEQYEAHPDPNDSVLSYVFADTTNQIDTWGREYDIYQEGGVLGAGSNNGSGNRQMFGKILTDDISDIEDWGVRWMQGGLNLLAAGMGVP